VKGNILLSFSALLGNHVTIGLGLFCSYIDGDRDVWYIYIIVSGEASMIEYMIQAVYSISKQQQVNKRSEDPTQSHQPAQIYNTSRPSPGSVQYYNLSSWNFEF